ncbi:MAG: serine kinase, partial [Deltaproteobacteria bacterium]|nr:serine kinase [Candidatus Desulfobacula maris]
MKLKDIIIALDLQVRIGRDLLEREVTGGYAGDLLSDVL